MQQHGGPVDDAKLLLARLVAQPLLGPPGGGPAAQQGQQVVAKDGYIPLPAAVVKKDLELLAQ